MTSKGVGGGQFKNRKGGNSPPVRWSGYFYIQYFRRNNDTVCGVWKRYFQVNNQQNMFPIHNSTLVNTGSNI